MINTFSGNENKDGRHGKQPEKLMLVCTISSYTILGVATWRATQFMREDPNKRTLFYWCIKFFCVEALLLSVLVFWYQNHLKDDDDVIVKLACSIWTVLGLVATSGICVKYCIMSYTRSLVEITKTNELKINKHHSKERIMSPPKKMRNSASDALVGLSLGLLLAFMDIAYYAHFKYHEPWIAIVAIVTYVQLVVAAVWLSVQRDLEAAAQGDIIVLKFLNAVTSIGLAVTYGMILPDTIDTQDFLVRLGLNKVQCGMIIPFMICIAFLD